MEELPEGMFAREGDTLTYAAYPHRWLERYTERIQSLAAALTPDSVLDSQTLWRLREAIRPLAETNIYEDGICTGLTEWLTDFVSTHTVGDRVHLGGTADFHV